MLYKTIAPIAVSLLAAACSGKAPEQRSRLKDVESTDLGSVKGNKIQMAVADQFLFERKTLTVCWRTDLDRTSFSPAIQEDGRQNIGRAFSLSFSAQTTGIVIADFRSCAELPNATIHIFYDDTMDSIGVASHFARMQGDPNFDRPTIRISLKGFFESAQASGLVIPAGTALGIVALHEMGHILGMQHEHAHPRSTCRATEESALEFFATGGTDEYLDRGTPYDPQSIMSYCNVRFLLHGAANATPDPAWDASRAIVGLSRADQAFIFGIYRNVPQ